MSDKLYFNGDILTMEDEMYIDSLLVKSGKIFKIGKKEDLDVFVDESIELINLEGKTLMPSFIDTHSHFTGYANSLLQVPLDNATSYDDIVVSIKNFIKENDIKPGEWIVAKGYDQNSLDEKTHPTKEILDLAAPDNPVVIQHQSGHMGVFSSKALESLEITTKTQSPNGGIIQIENGNLTGYLEENAFINYVQKVPMISFDKFKNAIIKAQNIYSSYGITTMQEGMVVELLADILDFLKSSKVLKIDLIAYIDLKSSKDLINRFKDCIKSYNNRLKIGGYKIFLDGSPQGRTAWMLKPYKNDNSGYKGYPIYTDDDLQEKIQTAIKENMQLLAHCNGDAAAKQYITQYKIAKEILNPKNDIRPVIIHAQLIAKEHLEDVKNLNMIPSIFIAHVYYWGDIHIQNFGIERASSISPAKSALTKGVKFTFHQDSPVTEPNMLETVWCAVNRTTKNDVILGESEKISPIEALKAVTINAAYQYFEEDLKGSIKEGKLADLVILDSNPLKVDPLKIKDIKVLETIKEGKTIFKSK